MNKKAQSDIITTVLTILLVLAAVIIASITVNSIVQRGASQATDKSKCLEISLNAVYANSTSDSITITRAAGGDDADVSDVTILVDGVAVDINATKNPTRSMKVQSSQTISLSNISSGQSVQVAPILSSGYKCDPSTTVVKAV